MSRAAMRRAPPQRGPRAAAARAQRGKLLRDLIDFASHLKVGEGQLVGQPLRLMDWQVKWLGEVFGGDRPRRRAILSVARRNGKTGLVAIIVLAALFGPLAVPNSRILAAARAREQASIVFDYCRKMLLVSGLIHLVRIRESAREIMCPRTGVTFRAISADAVTAVGFGARLVIHDELGQVRGPRDALYEALSSGMGSYADSLEIIISTQAPTDADLMSLLLDDALAGTDPAVHGTLHAAPKDCDLSDAAAWRAANPSLGEVRDEEDLARMASEAARLPSQEAKFRNFQLNQRVSASDSFITPAIWAGCSGPVDEAVLRAGPCYAGLDLSRRLDLTALSLVAKDSAGVWHVRQFAWSPGSTLEARARRDKVPYDIWRNQGLIEAPPGASLDYEILAQRLAEIGATYPITTIGCDRWNTGELKRELDRLGVVLPLTEVGQGFKDMSGAVDLLEQLMVQRRLRHGDNQVLMWCMSNVRFDQDAAGNRKPNKKESWGRIDCAVSLMIALKATVLGPEQLELTESPLSWV